MKRTLLLSLLGLFLLALAVGCGDKKDQATDDDAKTNGEAAPQKQPQPEAPSEAKTPATDEAGTTDDADGGAAGTTNDADGDAAAPAPGDRHALKAKFLPGTWNTVQTQDQTVKTRGQTQKSRNVVHMNMVISGPAADGSKTATLRFTRMLLRQGPLTVDTDEIAEAPAEAAQPATPQAMVERMLKAMMGAKIVLHVNADNEVVEVSGLNDLWDRIGAQMGPMGQALSQAMKKSFDDKTMSRLANPDYLLPDKPVAAGETWKKDLEKMPVPFLGSSGMKYAMKLNRFEQTGGHTVAVIDFTGRVTSDKTTTTDMGAMKMQVSDVDLTQKGTLHFDVDEGMVVRQEMKQTGTMKVGSAGAAEPVEAIELDQTVTTVATPADAGE